MLTLTPNAADAIKGLVGSAGGDESSGLRIASQPVSENEATLELALTDGPLSGDQVVEDQGATVFLEAEAAAFLNDKVLDAEIEGDSVKFQIGQQSSPDS